MLLRLLLFSILLYAAIDSHSQNYVDLLKVHHTHYASTAFSDSASLKRGFEEFVFDLKAPLRVNSNLVIVSGLYSEYTKLRLYSQSSQQTQIYSITPVVGVNYKWNEKWKSTFVFLPKLASDFIKIGRSDFQFGGNVLLEKMANKVKYKFGLYYNGEKSGSLFVPLLGLYYLSKNSKLEVDVVAPVWADLNYAVQKRVKLGVNFRSVVRSYHLNSEWGSRYVVKSVNELFVYLQFNLSKRLILQGKAGYSIGRNHRVYNSGDQYDFALSAVRFGDDRLQQNADFKNGLMFQTRLIYRLQL